MMVDMYITKEELQCILKIMKENNVDGPVKLIYENSSGIGSTLNMEFDHVLNQRHVTVRANITDSDSW